MENLLRSIPVAVNNFYGDPVLQWANTKRKLIALADDGHTGPVGLITKGHLSKRYIADISAVRNAGLNVIALVSISELENFERIGHAHRYENIRNLRLAGIPTIGYLRPFVPPFNTEPSVLRLMITRIADAGGNTVVASGFRGDDGIVSKMNPEDKAKWVMRVKLMPKQVFDTLLEECDYRGIQLFTRTSCGVSYLSGDTSSYNPYWNSPKLVRCSDVGCPMLSTCKGRSLPKPGSLPLLKKLGYSVAVVAGDNSAEPCRITGANRLDCPSCCTTCYMAAGNTSHIRVMGRNTGLADLSFIRFLTGMLTMKPGVNDDGCRDIGNVRLPNYPEINFQVLNSWMPWSRTLNRCFRCDYCVVSEYYNENDPDVGFSPVRLLNMI